MNTQNLPQPIPAQGLAHLPSLDFVLPHELEASEPPEERGLRRDQVRLMVSHRQRENIVHTKFTELPGFLQPGDVLAINTSGTLNAALTVRRENGQQLEMHISTHLPANQWVVELRQPAPEGTAPFYAASAGERLSLPAGGLAVLHAPYQGQASKRQRLWKASLDLPIPFQLYLENHGFPIRYKYVRSEWPLEYYQNVYSTEPGSAEMPSAGRAFTPELITQLVARGVLFAPVILHTGVASLEEDEKPYEEYYRVPPTSAAIINTVHAYGGRVIAVGTTVVRALQTVSEPDGHVRSGEGWTSLIVTPKMKIHAIDGMLTGFHEPRSTHLSMLLAIAGEKTILQAYREAIKKRYLWHEFGDLHLILP